MESRETIAADELSPEEDEQLVRVLDAYLADVEAGVAADPAVLLAQHPELAPRLRTCLAGLQMLDAATPASEAAKAELGGYAIVGEIGRGGMGVVYEALRTADQERVALKVLPFAASLDPRQLQRFKNEAHAASHLHHPHIVPVYEVGWAGGTHYYTMRFIEGVSLAAIWHQQRRQSRADFAVQRKTVTPDTVAAAADLTRDAASPAGLRWNSASYVRTIARWAQQAALALEHAHQVGVVHRDIKPGNLLVDEHGHLWVTDFGLASVQGSEGLTLTGDLVGTLRYMSPEQASARRGVVDHRTDIYSLGVTLYELLTLHQAFHGQDRQELLSQMASEEPRGARRLNPAVPLELETIVQTAMAKAPEDRYATARALADDLDCFLANKPIQARRPRLPMRLARWAGRHRAWVAAIGLFLFVTAVGLAAIWGALRAEAQQRVLAQVRELDSRRHLYAAHMNLALEDWQRGHVARVHELLKRQQPEPGQKDLRAFEWYHLARLTDHGCCATLPTDGKPVLALAASTDGRLWAAAGESGAIHLWDATAMRPRLVLPAVGGAVRGLAIAPQGDRLAAAYSDGIVRIWDLNSESFHLALRGHSSIINAVAFTPDGRLLVSCGTGDGTVRLWDAKRGELQRTLTGADNNANCLAVSPDGRLLVVAGNDRKILLWDLHAQQPEAELLGEHRVYVHCLAFSPDGQTLLSGSEDGYVKLWDLPRRKLISTFRRHTGAVAGAVFLRDGQVASVSWDGSVKVWDTATELVSLQQGHPGQVFAVALAADGKRLLSAGEDGLVRVWDLATNPEPLVLTCDKGLIRGLAFSPDSQRLVSAGNDRTVRIWDLSQPHQPLVVGQHADFGMAALFNPAGSEIITADLQGNVTTWDAATGSEIEPLEPVRGPLWSLAQSPDGKTLAAAGYTSNAVVLWDVATGKKRATLTGHQDRVWSVVFSPDGKLIASGANDYTVRLWDAASGKQVASIPVSEQWVFSLAFSPDGKILAIAGGDRRVHLWDVLAKKEREPLGLAPAGLRCVAFFPDSQTLVVGSDDGTVKLWDLITRQERATLHVEAASVWSVAVAPDGHAVAAGDGDGRITVWRAR